MELTEGDSLEGSAYTPMNNPNILSLILIEFLFILSRSRRDKFIQGRAREEPKEAEGEGD